MGRKSFAFLLASALAIGGVFYPAGSPLTAVSRSRPTGTAETRPHIAEAYGRLPLSFEANRGQADPQVRFLARGPQQTLFLTSTEAVLVVTKPAPPGSEPPAPRNAKPRGSATGTVLRMSFAGANQAARVTGLEELPGKAHYFIGNNPAQWRPNVPTYAKVRYDDLYPGIDLIYDGTQRHLEYDFVVRPGADPHRIALRLQGADRLEVDSQGDLVLHTAAGVIRQRKPAIYQEIGAVRKEIPGGYVLSGAQQIGFQVAAYDATRPLVIDPVLVYSTYLEGSVDDYGYGIAVDGSGNAYVTGYTVSTDFPTTAGAFQTTARGNNDAFVAKINPSGSALVYSTYLGGNANDYGYGIAVDGSGNAYVTGSTTSPDFPTTAGAFQPDYGGAPNGGHPQDAFVTKINPSGSALVYSTYLGGNIADYGTGIAVDAQGSAYVTGNTDSFSDFPRTAGAVQPAYGNGGTDAFVTKLNPTGTALAYSTFLGGNGADYGTGIAVDAQGSAYVTGYTFSSDFPTTPGAFQTAKRGNSSTFVTKFNPAGTALVYSTFLGGNGGDGNISTSDVGNGITVDGSGSAYVTGSTASPDFPTTAGAVQPTFGGLEDAFVTKFNPTGTALVYSTFLGGSSYDVGTGIALDTLGYAYVTGYTGSTNFPTTAGAFQRPSSNKYLVFVAKLNPPGSALVYSTYLGGSGGNVTVGGGDFGTGIAVDGSGNAYVTGYTQSPNFPTTPGAFQPTYGGGATSTHAFVVKLSGGIALIQQAANSGTNIPSLTVTLPRPPQPGDMLIVTNVSNNNQVSVSGGGVTSWNYAWSQVHENTVIVFGTVGSSPSATVTMTLIGSPVPGDLASIVSEWAGVTGNVNAGGGGTAGTASPIRTAAATPANANDLLIAVGGDTGGMTPNSWTAFTAPAQQPRAKIEAAYQVVSASGRYSHTWSDTGSTGWDAVIAALQGSGIALVQQAANSNTNTPSLTVTLPQTPRPGDVLVVTNVSNNTQVNVSGGGVSSWNYVWSQAHENTVIVYGTVGSSPSAILKLTLMGSPNPGDLASVVSEWTGLSGTADGSGTASGTASPIKTAAATTANANDLLIAVGGDTGSMTPGWWTAFTPPTQQPHAKIEAAYQVVSATGSYSNTWSDIGSTGWDAVIGAFK